MDAMLRFCSERYDPQECPLYRYCKSLEMNNIRVRIELHPLQISTLLPYMELLLTIIQGGSSACRNFPVLTPNVLATQISLSVIACCFMHQIKIFIIIIKSKYHASGSSGNRFVVPSTHCRKISSSLLTWVGSILLR